MSGLSIMYIERENLSLYRGQMWFPIAPNATKEFIFKYVPFWDTGDPMQPEDSSGPTFYDHCIPSWKRCRQVHLRRWQSY